jgi:hypothetical protein
MGTMMSSRPVRGVSIILLPGLNVATNTVRFARNPPIGKLRNAKTNNSQKPIYRRFFTHILLLIM